MDIIQLSNTNHLFKLTNTRFPVRFTKGIIQIGFIISDDFVWSQVGRQSVVKVTKYLLKYFLGFYIHQCIEDWVILK